jgi:hypothetical protein
VLEYILLHKHRWLVVRKSLSSFVYYIIYGWFSILLSRIFLYIWSVHLPGLIMSLISCMQIEKGQYDESMYSALVHGYFLYRVWWSNAIGGFAPSDLDSTDYSRRWRSSCLLVRGSRYCCTYMRLFWYFQMRL